MFRVKPQRITVKAVTAVLLSFLFLLSALAHPVPLKAGAEAEEEWFLSYPSEAVFDSLWVGDSVCFESQIYYLWEDKKLPEGNTMTVLSGDCVEIGNFQYIEMCGNCLCFTKPGKAQVKIKETNAETGESREKTFSFTVTERPADKPLTLVYGDTVGEVKLKLGQRAVDAAPFKEVYDGQDNFEKSSYEYVGVEFKNAGYGFYPAGEIGGYTYENGRNMDGRLLDFSPAYGGAIPCSWVGDDRTAYLSSTDWMHFADRLEYGYAIKPGTTSLDILFSDLGGVINMGHFGDITVEEPVITSDAPVTAKAGSTVRLNTALTNTALQNMKTAEYEDEDNYYYYEFYEEYEYNWYERGYNPVAYKPSVTVIEGSDCVAQSEQDYTNTLSSSETLTFIKPGTVKLKITYTQFATSSSLLYYYDWESEQLIDNDLRYNPEKIITIQVTDANGNPKGDANGDGKVNNMDASSVLKYDAGIGTFTDAQFALLDINGDGAVNNIDSARILQFDAGVIDVL